MHLDKASLQMEEQIPFRPSSFADIEILSNPEQRCSCVLVLDCSGSMQGRQIDSLNAAVRRFAEELREDDLAAKRVEIGVISFGSRVEVVSEFRSVQAFYPDDLAADGGTPMGQAMCEAVRMIERRKQTLNEHGVQYYRPWLVLMTDGEPTDSRTQYWRDAVDLVASSVTAGKFTFFPLVTEDGNKSVVGQLSPETQVRGLDSHKFSEFFLWLTRSLQGLARSQPGDKLPLPDPSDWFIDV